MQGHGERQIKWMLQMPQPIAKCEDHQWAILCHEKKTKAANYGKGFPMTGSLHHGFVAPQG
jgi:hypothetical protein